MSAEIELRSTSRTFHLRQLLVAVGLFALLFALFGPEIRRYLKYPRVNGWKRVSPFTDVQVAPGGVVYVRFEGNRYQLVSVNDFSTSRILSSSRDQFGDYWEKRFVEDFYEVLVGLGARPKKTVKLVLRDVLGKITTVDDAPMTHENRQQVYRTSTVRQP